MYENWVVLLHLEDSHHSCWESCGGSDVKILHDWNSTVSCVGLSPLVEEGGGFIYIFIFIYIYIYIYIYI